MHTFVRKLFKPDQGRGIPYLTRVSCARERTIATKLVTVEMS
jgi:hypothetical protein